MSAARAHPGARVKRQKEEKYVTCLSSPHRRRRALVVFILVMVMVMVINSVYTGPLPHYL